MSIIDSTIRVCALCLAFTMLSSGADSVQASIRGIHTATGWAPPTKDMVSSVDSGSLTVDGVNVTRRVLTLKDEIHEAEQGCFMREVIAYSLGDVVFAYEVPCVAGGFENGAKIYAGAVYVSLYYDETGDGQFKTRYIGRKSLFIPKWLKEPAHPPVPSGAQPSSTVIKVLDATEVQGIEGVVILINSGDARKSQAFITNERGEAVVRNLHCQICTISAFDPRELFLSRTTEFSSFRDSFVLVMQVRPIIETLGDPKAAPMELVLSDSTGKPLSQRDVVIRPTLMTFENKHLFVLSTDSTGHVNAELGTGDYTVGTVNGDTAFEARFEIRNSKKWCSSGAACVVIPSLPLRHKTIQLRLSLKGTAGPA